MSAPEGRRPATVKGRKTPSGDRQDEKHREEALDEALEESFPASDPPSPTRPRDHPDRPPKGR